MEYSEQRREYNDRDPDIVRGKGEQKSANDNVRYQNRKNSAHDSNQISSQAPYQASVTNSAVC